MKIDEIARIKQRYDKPIMDLWAEQTYFCIEEIVPGDVFKAKENKIIKLHNLIEIFHENAIRTLIEIRDLFAYPITINDWEWGGPWHYRGYRPASYYSATSYSQHLFGNAFDFDVKGHTANEAREKIIQWKKEGFLKYLTGLELNINWVHIDCRISDQLDENGLFTFNP